MKYNLRIPHVDIDKAEYNIEYRSGDIPEVRAMIAAEPDVIPQGRLFGIVDDYLRLGLLKYALGLDLSKCRDLFRNTVITSIEAFRLRGTQDAFPVMDVFFDPSKPKGDPDRARIQQRHAPGTKDFSLTNSNDAYFYTCLALGIGDEALAKEQAGLMWDPPDGGGYIGPKSEVCTPNQQAMAFALRDLLNGQRDAALANVSKVRALPNDYIFKQSQLLKSLIQRDADAYLKNLNELLEKNERISKREKWRPQYYICVPALGMSYLAMKSGLVRQQDFPASIYLPTSLFS